MSFELTKIFGLHRSGNHAIINWLLGLNVEGMFFINNLHAGKDVLANPSGISLPKEVKTFATREGGVETVHYEAVDAFRKTGGTLVCSFENLDMNAFDNDELNAPIVKEFGKPFHETNIIVLRNPFNVMPSTYKRLERNRLDRKRIEKTIEQRMKLWNSYANLFVRKRSRSRGPFLGVLYDRWVREKDYRNMVARKLNYVNYDRYIDFVSDAGGGSSFEGTALDVTMTNSRWRDFALTELFRGIVQRNKDLLDYAIDIFGEENVPVEALSQTRVGEFPQLRELRAHTPISDIRTAGQDG
jgi:hypothetical protein